MNSLQHSKQKVLKTATPKHKEKKLGSCVNGKSEISQSIVPPSNDQSDKNSKSEHSNSFTIKIPRIIIRNIPFTTTEKRLRKKVEQYGEISAINILGGKGQINAGFAFVTFSELSQAANCIQNLNGSKLGGRIIAVDWSVPKSVYQRFQTSSAADAKNQEIDELTENNQNNLVGKKFKNKSSEDKQQRLNHDDTFVHGSKDVQAGETVFLSNLSLHTSERAIEDVLSHFGEIRYVKLVRDKITGRSKGSAFVRFKSSDYVESVMQSLAHQDNTISIDLSDVKVAKAIPRSQLLKQIHDRSSNKTMTNEDRSVLLARKGNVPVDEVKFKADLIKRDKLKSIRKEKLKNPAEYFVSPLRLEIHNLPFSFTDEKQLRQMAMNASGNINAKLTECKIIMSKKTSKEDQSGGLSAGRAFVQFTSESDAEHALNILNNNPYLFPNLQRRLIVMFSIENRRALRIKKRIKEKNLAKINQAL
ncbi:hypothetical protein GJ496_007285 [Pomphorhynchus laevis]|nr:hypothetical protein GJ496_007285 [Pomphorhynchus laevis]